ncbi:translation initiation factor IF-2-like isoform X1 [Pteropus medius]|uniref:translation initiation factor IF-2-like isoform X1 n=1 Tax=Pteropus vampyrus TaxID=132908 RepID=UPI00196B55A5|nr:translation initiation factor IF-2-like isoform X1 [Pteropus giganteus]
MVNTSHTAARSTSDPARVNKVSVGGRAAAAAKVPLAGSSGLPQAAGRRPGAPDLRGSPRPGVGPRPQPGLTTTTPTAFPAGHGRDAGPSPPPAPSAPRAPLPAVWVPPPRAPPHGANPEPSPSSRPPPPPPPLLPGDPAPAPSGSQPWMETTVFPLQLVESMVAKPGDIEGQMYIY